MIEVQLINKDNDTIIRRFPDGMTDSFIQTYCIQQNCVMVNKRYIPDHEGGLFQ